MWTNNILDLQPQPPEKYKAWMLKVYQVSTALRAATQILTVNVQGERFDEAYSDEYALFEMETSEHCYIREVFLEQNTLPFSYGRVVVPIAVYDRYQEEFKTLGARPIGETMLYGKDHIKRAPFQFAALMAPHPLYQRLVELLPAPLNGAEVYFARRSLFYLDNKSVILVVEVYTEAIPVLS